MARSSWKYNYTNLYIFKKIFLSKFKNSRIGKVFCRSSSIPKIFLKKTVTLYKGSAFIRILFTRYHIGLKLGEFGVTRKPFSYPIKKKKKKKR